MSIGRLMGYNIRLLFTEYKFENSHKKEKGKEENRRTIKKKILLLGPNRMSKVMINVGCSTASLIFNFIIYTFNAIIYGGSYETIASLPSYPEKLTGLLTWTASRPAHDDHLHLRSMIKIIECLQCITQNNAQVLMSHR